MTERNFMIAVFGGAALVLALATWLRFGEDFESRLPPLPTPPASSDPGAVRRTDFTPDMYNAYLQKDAEFFGIAPPDLNDLQAPFAYEKVTPKQILPPGDPPFTTRTLAISMRVDPLTATTSRGTFTVEHLILHVENQTDQYVAYKIETTPGLDTPRCLTKADLAFDAIAIRPHEVLERTECVFRDGARPTIESVETMVIPEISYYYVSRLYPAHIGLEQRTSRGHKIPKGDACTTIPEQAIRLGMQKNSVTWRDVIDFYARHRCDTYFFPIGYRAFTKKNERQLPVSPRDVSPAEPQ